MSDKVNPEIILSDIIEADTEYIPLFSPEDEKRMNNRIDRWVMVTVRAASPYGVALSRPRDRAEVERFLRKIGEVLP